MRRFCGDGDLARRGDHGVERLHPLDGRAVLLLLLDLAGVDQRERKVAGDEEAREQAVAAALLRLLAGERAHELRALVAAPVVEHRRIPLDVALIDGELAGPLRLQQVGP